MKNIYFYGYFLAIWLIQLLKLQIKIFFFLLIQAQNNIQVSIHIDYKVMGILVHLLFCLCFYYKVICELKPQRLSVVDKNIKLNNFLVRGNLPISDDKKFQMKELKHHLSQLTGLKEYELIVISFLNFLTAKQTKNRYIQEKFFDKNTKYGQYRHKIILGSLFDPSKLPQIAVGIVNFMEKFISIDDLQNFIQELHYQIHQSGKNKIVYFHCSAGMDRTGLVSGAYKMKYLKYSLKQVLEENQLFGGPRKYMHFNALNGLKWYCLSVKKTSRQCLDK